MLNTWTLLIWIGFQGYGITTIDGYLTQARCQAAAEAIRDFRANSAKYSHLVWAANGPHPYATCVPAPLFR